MKDYVSINQDDGEIAYGGNQRWFSDERIQKYGCGLVSCTDILLCITDKADKISKEDYLAFSDILSKRHLKVRKRLGLNGISMAFGMNRFFKNNNLPYKAKWGVLRRKKFQKELEGMLYAGIPVCLSIGPNLYIKPCGVDFYSDLKHELPSREKVSDHYVTVTDTVEKNGEKWFEISSWGKKFFIKQKDYFEYKKRILTFFSNILIIKQIK